MFKRRKFLASLFALPFFGASVKGAKGGPEERERGCEYFCWDDDEIECWTTDPRYAATLKIGWHHDVFLDGVCLRGKTYASSFITGKKGWVMGHPLDKDGKIRLLSNGDEVAKEVLFGYVQYIDYRVDNAPA